MTIKCRGKVAKLETVKGDKVLVTLEMTAPAQETLKLEFGKGDERVNEFTIGRSFDLDLTGKQF
jgi:hypothetical protein